MQNLLARARGNAPILSVRSGFWTVRTPAIGSCRSCVCQLLQANDGKPVRTASIFAHRDHFAATPSGPLVSGRAAQLRRWSD
jgi:hypothetical protein